jgi:hypothetical protein
VRENSQFSQLTLGARGGRRRRRRLISGWCPVRRSAGSPGAGSQAPRFGPLRLGPDGRARGGGWTRGASGAELATATLPPASRKCAGAPPWSRSAPKASLIPRVVPAYTAKGDIGAYLENRLDRIARQTAKCENRHITPSGGEPGTSGLYYGGCAHLAGDRDGAAIEEPPVRELRDSGARAGHRRASSSARSSRPRTPSERAAMCHDESSKPVPRAAAAASRPASHARSPSL